MVHFILFQLNICLPLIQKEKIIKRSRGMHPMSGIISWKIKMIEVWCCVPSAIPFWILLPPVPGKCVCTYLIFMILKTPSPRRLAKVENQIKNLWAKKKMRNRSHLKGSIKKVQKWRKRREFIKGLEAPDLWSQMNKVKILKEV